MNGFARRARLTAVLLSILVVVSVSVSPVVRPAHAADASIVFGALRVLVERHVDTLDPVALLGGALNGLRQALTRAGISEPLPDLAGRDAGAVREEFQQRFDQAVSLAGGKLNETALQYAAARGLAASVPGSHTAFLDAEQWEFSQRRNRNEATYTGIGTRSIVRDGRFYLLEIFPNSPAALAGLRSLDRVIAIDGESVDGLTSAEFSGRIRGPDGTTVVLTIKRQGIQGPFGVSVRRRAIARTTIESRMLSDGIGYIRFTEFIPGSAAMMRDAIQSLQAEGLRGLILDLRGNPGGRVLELNAIAGMLLGPGLTIFVQEDREQGRSTYTTRGAPVLPSTTPLTVMIDEGSASASEILSAAIQEHGRGAIVGAKSAGAVLVSVTIPLPGGTAVQVAIRRVLAPSGRALEGTGVQPDQLVLLTSEDLDRGVDAQFARSVQMTVQRVASAALSPWLAGTADAILPKPAYAARQ
jgi:carboxyl-terminal processing protease